jgi:hypothetical protein
LGIIQPFRNLPAKMSSPEKHVRIHDFKNKSSTTIPAAELAPGMIEVRIQGLEGTYWINPRSLEKTEGPVRHPPFDAPRRGKIRKIMGLLKEVYPLTFEQWEDGFRRDLNADKEIDGWVRAAEIYNEWVTAHALDFSERKALFQILAACMTTSYEHVWQVLDASGVPEHVARGAIEEFYGQPALLKEFEQIRPEDYADEDGNIPFPVTALQDPTEREVLKSADIIFGVDSFTGNRTPFFGTDRLKRIVASGESGNVGVVSILYDSRTPQLEYLMVMVEELKGTCDYGRD